MKPIIKTLLQPLVRSAIAKRNAQFEDGIYAGLAGSGSPLPDFHRVGLCIAVLAGKHFFVVDAGEGSIRNVLLMNLPLIRADAILLTRFSFGSHRGLGRDDASALGRRRKQNSG